MTSSNGNIFCVTGHLCGEFTGHRWIPCTKANDAELWRFLWSSPNKRLSKQSRGWWFEMLLHPFWRHNNVTLVYQTDGSSPKVLYQSRNWTLHRRDGQVLIISMGKRHSCCLRIHSQIVVTSHKDWFWITLPDSQKHIFYSRSPMGEETKKTQTCNVPADGKVLSGARASVCRVMTD